MASLPFRMTPIFGANKGRDDIKGDLSGLDLFLSFLTGNSAASGGLFRIVFEWQVLVSTRDCYSDLRQLCSAGSIGRANNKPVEDLVNAGDASNQTLDVGQVAVRFERAFQADAAFDLANNERRNTDFRLVGK